MDLLLIIVFAQYLEFQRNEKVAIDRLDSQIESNEKRITAELTEATEQFRQQQRDLRQQRDTARTEAEEAQRRLELTTSFLKTLLDVDPQWLDRELSPPAAIENVESAQRLAEQLRESNRTELLRLLAGYDELLKRAEVWTLHVSDRDLTVLQPARGDALTQSFRLEANSQSARAEEFVQQFRAAYSQLPQPKGLVVILVTFSPRAIAGNYQPVLDAMPDVIEWLETDAEGQVQFEYAVLGAITDPVRDQPSIDPSNSQSTRYIHVAATKAYSAFGQNDPGSDPVGHHAGDTKRSGLVQHRSAKLQ